MRYARLLLMQLRASMLLALQYRADFLLDGFVEVFWMVPAIVPLLVVFQRASARHVAAWTFGEALMVVGWFTFLQGVLEGVINPSLVTVVEHIRKGTLDFVLLKPADAQFLVSTARVLPWRSVNVFTAVGIFAWGFHLLGRGPTLADIGMAAAAMVAAVVALYSLWMLTVSAAFYVVRIDNLSQLFSAIFDAARWPVSVFPRVVRLALHLRRPLALMTTYPAQALLRDPRAKRSPSSALCARGRHRRGSRWPASVVWNASIARYIAPAPVGDAAAQSTRLPLTSSLRSRRAQELRPRIYGTHRADASEFGRAVVLAVAMALLLLAPACGLRLRDQLRGLRPTPRPTRASATRATRKARDGCAPRARAVRSSDAPPEAAASDGATGRGDANARRTRRAAVRRMRPATRSRTARRRSLRRTGSGLLRDGHGVPGRRLLLGRDVRRARVVSDQRQRVPRRDARRVRGRWCRPAALLPERDVRRQAVLRRRAVRRAGPELRRRPAPRDVPQRRLRHVRRRRPDVLHGRSRRAGQRGELLHRVGRGVQSRHEQVRGLRWKRPAVLRRGLVRGRRLLRSDGEDLRREHGDVRRRPGQVLRRRLHGRRLRRCRRSLLRRRRRVHRSVLGLPGQRVRRLRRHGRALLPREQHGRRVVQRRRGLRGGQLRSLRGSRPGVLRGRRLQGGELHRGEVPVAESEK